MEKNSGEEKIMSDQLKEMRKLIHKLNEASKAYYQEAREIMSNFEYDALYDRLLELEKETGTANKQKNTPYSAFEAEYGVFFR